VKPTLTDPTATGGVVAQDGFDYQRWDAFTRLPAWLASPAFEQLVFEGFEDYEARFLAAHAADGHVIERYQAKSGDIGPKDVREVFEKFLDFEEAYPRRARLHALVTPRIPPTIAGVGADPGRVRRLRPFYAPFSDVVQASDDKLSFSSVFRKMQRQH
jgi:hypothetical protein